jgi:hypothetical protein
MYTLTREEQELEEAKHVSQGLPFSDVQPQPSRAFSVRVKERSVHVDIAEILSYSVRVVLACIAVREHVLSLCIARRAGMGAWSGTQRCCSRLLCWRACVCGLRQCSRCGLGLYMQVEILSCSQMGCGCGLSGIALAKEGAAVHLTDRRTEVLHMHTCTYINAPFTAGTGECARERAPKQSGDTRRCVCPGLDMHRPRQSLARRIRRDHRRRCWYSGFGCSELSPTPAQYTFPRTSKTCFAAYTGCLSQVHIRGRCDRRLHTDSNSQMGYSFVYHLQLVPDIWTSSTPQRPWTSMYVCMCGRYTRAGVNMESRCAHRSSPSRAQVTAQPEYGAKARNSSL